MGCIYKHTNNITQEAYIGYTSRNADKRKREHIRGDGNQPLKDAIDEFGENAFTFNEILEDGIINEFLPEREVYWIAKFDTFHNGYNCTSGGKDAQWSEESREKMRGENNPHYGKPAWNKGKPQPPETCKKISESLTGKKHPAKTLKKMSEARRGENNAFYGKTHSDEAKRKISKAKTGCKHSAESRQKISKSLAGRTSPMAGRKHSDETKRKMSATRKGKKLSPEHIRNSAEARKGFKQTAESKRKISESKRHPLFMFVHNHFISLPSGMPLKDKCKIIYRKFPQVNSKTIHRWIYKYRWHS